MPWLMKSRSALTRRCWNSVRMSSPSRSTRDRKSTRLNSSHTVIYTLSLHDALPIFGVDGEGDALVDEVEIGIDAALLELGQDEFPEPINQRSEEHTSELQSHRDLHSFPTRRSSDLRSRRRR